MQSTLARHADVVLDSSVDKEACPLNLAPTASTTTQMALGDALAVALLDAAVSGLKTLPGRIQAARWAGVCWTHVRDVMRSGAALFCRLGDADRADGRDEPQGIWHDGRGGRDAQGRGHLHRR